MIKSFVNYFLILLVLFLSANSQLFANTTLHHDVKSAGNLPENLLDDQTTVLHLFSLNEQKNPHNLQFLFEENNEINEDDYLNSFKKVLGKGKLFNFRLFCAVLPQSDSDKDKYSSLNFRLYCTSISRSVLFQVFRL